MRGESSPLSLLQCRAAKEKQERKTNVDCELDDLALKVFVRDARLTWGPLLRVWSGPFPPRKLGRSRAGVRRASV